jgi:alanine-glyoxylate transaminase/(R)-3-amino-2-methylpropionate-pyruvate transaminase
LLLANIPAPPPASVAPPQEPATAQVAAVFEACKDMGVLLGKGGLHGNVFRIKPPMCITKPDIDFLLEVMDTALAKA